MADITKSGILNAIKSLGDKKLNLNSLTLNSIKKIEQLNDTLTVDLSIPGLPAEGGFDKKVIADAIKKDFPGLKEIHVNTQTKTESPFEKDSRAAECDIVKVTAGLVWLFLCLCLQEVIP